MTTPEPLRIESAAALATLIDHTLLKPEATPADVNVLIAEALELGVFSVCVSPSLLPVEIPAGSGLRVATVCGFPSGTHAASIKAGEAALSVQNGADEVDMVIDLGEVKAGRFDRVEQGIRAVRDAVPAPALVKVIIESAALTDAEIVAACHAAESAGADFVKTSTGFHPAGGATVHAVQLMADTVGGRLGVKASGGIRSLAQALEMVSAGATRLGLSSSASILTEWDTPSVRTESGPIGY
ncbi:deoxyribose-phosphate aldolase [Klugiella xanthotipulae]|uniref:Deoxyribose-phosphate aldolase n=1 Tax=Klugiella xanthotipulae TaxID=244735 RepID=A0A543HT32_9MICO|nr:deoxyribose-phosphate aldolase [Klugiella xanthotipulae]TQM61511.1 deoxyribose-phosphate aldolase [Klugiella xanthotipulae]